MLSVASHIEVRGVPRLADWQRVAAHARERPAREGRRAVRRWARRCCRPATTSAARSCAASTRRARTRSPTSAAHMRAGTLADLEPGEFGIVLGARARARARRARGRHGRRDRAAGHGDAGRRAAAPQELHASSASSRSASTSSTAGSRSSNIEDAQRLYRLDGVTRRAPEARRPVRGAGGRARRSRERSAVDAEVRDWTRSHATSSARCRSRSA